jgi:hypothetical protein
MKNTKVPVRNTTTVFQSYTCAVQKTLHCSGRAALAIQLPKNLWSFLQTAGNTDGNSLLETVSMNAVRHSGSVGAEQADYAGAEL